jgi:redox-sensing transcriptional repressor
MRFTKIPDETIHRLPVYLRGLIFLSQQGKQNISSRNLAEFLGVNPWQIRKDFSYFGGFGKRGVGYDIQELIDEIKKIMNLSVEHKAALVGIGNIGAALIAYPGFKLFNFTIAAVFDVDPEKIGQKISDITIEDIAELPTLADRGIKVGIIAVPRQAAQQTVDKLLEAGVKGILNFSPCYLTVPENIKVISIDIGIDLARLPYYIPAE